MKILIIESTARSAPLSSDYGDTSIVHCRNSLILADYLNADLIDGIYKLREILKKKYDAIICSYASPYMPWREYRQILDANPEAELYWLVNDHDLEDNQLLRWAIIERGRTFKVICNNSREGYRHWILGKTIADKKLNDFITEWHVCNLNCLIFREDWKPNYSWIATEKQTCIYYGTFRKHRAKDFTEWLHDPIVLSCSKKHYAKFLSIGCTSKMIAPLTWERGAEGLQQFKYSLYIEDDHTHTNFAFMANRFYEAVMMDVVVIFAPNTRTTIKKSEYSVEPAIISDLNFNRISHESLLKAQQELKPRISQERLEVLRGIESFLHGGIVFSSDCTPCEFCDDLICWKCNGHFSDCTCLGPTSELIEN
jgi:hypothetical protein